MVWLLVAAMAGDVAWQEPQVPVAGLVQTGVVTGAPALPEVPLEWHRLAEQDAVAAFQEVPAASGFVALKETVFTPSACRLRSDMVTLSLTVAA